MIGQAKQIRKLIDEQISGKKEIVFLPYKASMWDSMESVWKAAAEDDECEVYVVPCSLSFSTASVLSPQINSISLHILAVVS